MTHLTAEKTGSKLNITFQFGNVSDPVVVESILAELVEKVQASGVANLNLDFSKVETISTAMLGALLTFRSHAMFHKISFVLCGLNQGLESVFTQSGLEGLFEIQPYDAEPPNSRPVPQIAGTFDPSFCLA